MPSLTILRRKQTPPDKLIYILTNETDPEYAKRIQQSFPLAVFEHSVKTLTELERQHPDNYRTFRVGQYIQSPLRSARPGFTSNHAECARTRSLKRNTHDSPKIVNPIQPGSQTRQLGLAGPPG